MVNYIRKFPSPDSAFDQTVCKMLVVSTSLVVAADCRLPRNRTGLDEVPEPTAAYGCQFCFGSECATEHSSFSGGSSRSGACRSYGGRSRLAGCSTGVITNSYMLFQRSRAASGNHSGRQGRILHGIMNPSHSVFSFVARADLVIHKS